MSGVQNSLPVDGTPPSPPVDMDTGTLTSTADAEPLTSSADAELEVYTTKPEDTTSAKCEFVPATSRIVQNGELIHPSP